MMDHKKEIIEELDSLSPMLAKWKNQERESSGGPPEGYFAQLPDQVLAKIKEESAKGKSNRRVLRIRRIRQITIGIAAVFALLVAGRFLFPGAPTEQGLADKASDTWLEADIPKAEIYDYVMNNLDDFDSELIMEAAATAPIDFVLPNTISESNDLDEMIDQLLEETDLSTINEFL